MWFDAGKPIARSIDWVPLIGTSFERHPIEKERFRVRFGSGKRNVDGSAKRDDEATHANEAQAQDRPRMEGVAVHKRKAEEMDEDDYDEEDPAKEESDAQALKKKQKVEGEDADAGQVGEERKPAKAPMLVPKDAQDTDRTMEENHANETPKGHRTKKQTMTEFQERNKNVLALFTDEQMNRYESFRRSAFQRSTIRKILTSITGNPASLPMTIVMCGIAKLFVGDLVETSRIVMSERGDTGPIQPVHLREAYERLRSARQIPIRGKVPRLFR